MIVLVKELLFTLSSKFVLLIAVSVGVVEIYADTVNEYDMQQPSQYQRCYSNAAKLSSRDNLPLTQFLFVRAIPVEKWIL